jgi:thiol-disulfide isomerase/thioredoxin
VQTPPAPAAPATLAPPPPPAAPASQPAGVREAWTTDFAAAQAEAAGSKKRLLVLFTGSDWCPPCMRFEAEVAHAPDFLNLAQTSFVLVKLDYPRNAPQSPAIRARNEELRRRYGVNSYPSLLVIDADGGKSLRVQSNKPRQADGLVDFWVQAVDEARRAKDKKSSWF